VIRIGGFVTGGSRWWGETFDPIWGSFGARGQKLWAKPTFSVLEFSEIFGQEVGVVDPVGTSGWISPTFHQNIVPPIWTQYDKQFRSYCFYSKWLLWGQGEVLPNLLFLNCYTEETHRRHYAKVNSAEMISTEFGDFIVVLWGGTTLLLRQISENF